MGQEIKIAAVREFDWANLEQSLTAVGEKAVVRMIDGLPAFPDERPEPGWKEVRISMNGGMVTLRRDGGEIGCVVWGNADAALLSSWKAFAMAVSELVNSPDT